MGTVSGVYLKYVVLSAGFTSAGISYLTDEWKVTSTAAALLYAGFANGAISAMFLARRGMELIGKDPQTGKVHWLSYLVWWPFFLPTYLYTYLHHLKDKEPAATEVLPGWWLGGRYADKLKVKQWGGIVDLTVEFEESCISQCAPQGYLNLSCWDGVPPPPADIQVAALHCANIAKMWASSSSAANDGGGGGGMVQTETSPSTHPILVHCAHGRGRSTTVLVAALVASGCFATWEEAFAHCKAKRPCVKLNAKMRAALTSWANEYNGEQKKVK